MVDTKDSTLSNRPIHPPVIVDKMMLGAPALFTDVDSFICGESPQDNDTLLESGTPMAPIDFHLEYIEQDTERISIRSGLVIVPQKEESRELLFAEDQTVSEGDLPEIKGVAPDSERTHPIHKSKDEPKAVILYQNPTLERLFIISASKKSEEFVILDTSGNVVHQASTTGVLSEVDVTGYAIGSYLLRIKEESGAMRTERFVVSH